MRLPRPQIEDCCVHVTHRCHRRQFLLDTDIDRRQYVRRLRESGRRFPAVRVLNYTLTSNHVHLLVWSPRMDDLSLMIKWLHGTFAGDFNRRHHRSGAFWGGRFHSTLVQTGNHLQRCLLYVDMNMVRAGVVRHPRHWTFGGYHELAGTRQRYRIIDMKRLLVCLGLRDTAAFRDWYGDVLDGLCRLPVPPSEPFWSSAFAVGDKSWLADLTGNDERLETLMSPADAGQETDESKGAWLIRASQAMGRRLARRLSAP